MPTDPAKLRVVHYPADILRRKAERVEPSPEVAAVARRMIELMYEHEGIGLAAPQVGLPWRLFVCHVPEGSDRSTAASPPTASAGPEVYLNPVLSDPLGPPEPCEEGCLSLPDITGEVLRPPVITVSATDAEGNPFQRTAAGLLARCWQHENDHLDGVLILDRMLQKWRVKNRSAIRALEQQSRLL